MIIMVLIMMVLTMNDFYNDYLYDDIFMMIMLTWNNNCERGVWVSRGRGGQHC